jgi:hypothetical protein
MDVLDFSVFDCDIRVESLDRPAASLLTSNYGWFKKAFELILSWREMMVNFSTCLRKI